MSTEAGAIQLVHCHNSPTRRLRVGLTQALGRMTSSARTSFVRALGSLLGLVSVGYGSLMLFGRPVGSGPCRVNCGLHDSFIALLGQPAYNLVFGLAWVSSALALLVFLFLVYGRK